VPERFAGQGEEGEAESTSAPSWEIHHDDGRLNRKTIGKPSQCRFPAFFGRENGRWNFREGMERKTGGCIN
jgi:hypothetical protein